jgi:2-phospho-L-lactate guanylyltransferase (CobY/MobA/RfbA family)
MAKTAQCTKHIIILCPENKILVKQKQAEVLHQTDVSWAVNKLLDELREIKRNK